VNVVSQLPLTELLRASWPTRDTSCPHFPSYICYGTEPLGTSPQVLQVRCHSCHPTNSVEALKETQSNDLSQGRSPTSFIISSSTPDRRGTTPVTLHCQYPHIINSTTDYRQHCVKCKQPVFNLLRSRFWGFSPRRGDTLHRWGWNLARGPVLRAKFHSHRCNG